MQLGAMTYQNSELPLESGSEELGFTQPVADEASDFVSPPPRATRSEWAAMIALSLIAHAGVGMRFAFASNPQRTVVEREVAVEMIPPPKPPEPEPTHEPEPPAAEKPVPKKVEPRVVPRLAPPPTAATAAPTDDLPQLPEGDDPSLSSASGNGLGSLAPVAPPPAPTPVAPPPPPPPAPIVAAHEGANYLKNPRPAYPEVAMRKGWEGDVLLSVRVAPDGRPLSVSVQKSSGRDVLDQAAITAVRGWSFVPARQGGQPVAGSVTVPIVFHLQ